MPSRRDSAAVAAAAALLSLALAPAAGTAAAKPALRFGPPVLVSPPLASPWEPTLLVDRFENIFITARKDLAQLALAPDERSPTATRSMSWLWVSTDGGKTFGNLEGLPLDANNHEWGYEGAVALDGADHLYFVDQTYADATLTRWTITGRGTFVSDLHRPFLPTGQPVDDRPWLAAHGDGKVFTIVNSGDATLNPLGREGGEAYGPGRFSIYRSTDGGQTFDTIGHSLNGSGGCRPAADERAGSKLVYVACTNDGGVEGPLDVPQGRGTLWAYVSDDDGETYTRHRIGDYNADADTYDWPLVEVGPNGDVFVVHNDADKVLYRDDGSFQILTNKVMLYHSKDHGRTWSRQDITPREGRYRWGWLDVSSKGEVGWGIHHRIGATEPWRVYASVFRPGIVPELVSIDEEHPVDTASSSEPPAEFVGLAFAPDDTLAVAWTRTEATSPVSASSVYFARSIPPKAPARPAVKGSRTTRDPLPATGIPPGSTGASVMLAGAAAAAAWLSRATRGARP